MSPTLKEEMDDGLVNFRSTAYALLAENQQLRDALTKQAEVLAPLDAKIDFSLHMATTAQMTADLTYLRGLLADARTDALAAVRVEDDPKETL